jgi:hypothetical protein
LKLQRKQLQGTSSKQAEQADSQVTTHSIATNSNTPGVQARAVASLLRQLATKISQINFAYPFTFHVI